MFTRRMFVNVITWIGLVVALASTLAGDSGKPRQLRRARFTQKLSSLGPERALSCAPLFFGHGIQFQPQMVAWGIAEILFHAQVAFRGLDRGMAK